MHAAWRRSVIALTQKRYRAVGDVAQKRFSETLKRLLAAIELRVI
jgi:hypothetical protein